MILVTGATGHTGSRLVKKLVETGHKVRCLVRTPRNAGYLPGEGIEIVYGDLKHEEKVRKALKGINILFHAAHIRFASDIIPIAKNQGVNRALFMSSTRRYTKFACESADAVIKGEDYIKKSGMDYTILRPTMIYGGARDNNMTKLVNHLGRFRIFPIFGNGKNLIQPVFVWDLVEAMVYCVDHPETAKKEFTLAGPEPLTYRGALEIIAGQLNRKVFLLPVPLFLCSAVCRIYEKCVSRPRITSDQVRRFGENKAFDISKAREEIAFSPRSFKEGIRLKIAGEV